MSGTASPQWHASTCEDRWLEELARGRPNRGSAEPWPPPLHGGLWWTLWSDHHMFHFVWMVFSRLLHFYELESAFWQILPMHLCSWPEKYNSPNTCETRLEVNEYVMLVCQISLSLTLIDGLISSLLTVNKSASLTFARPEQTLSWFWVVDEELLVYRYNS